MPLHRASASSFGLSDIPGREWAGDRAAGTIQPSGALLVLRESDRVVVQASANAPGFLGLDGEVLGRRVEEIEGDLAQVIATRLPGMALRTPPLATRCHVGRGRAAFDVVLHRPPQGGLVAELEHAGALFDRSAQVEDALRGLLATHSLRSLCDEAAKVFGELTGYDRVTVCRFDDAGHGEVMAEERRADPASCLRDRAAPPDVERQPRERSRVRMLVNVGDAAVPILPPVSPITGQPLDMSLCLLRNVSAAHARHLESLGVVAALVVSIVVGERPWGFIACHHPAPRAVPFEARATCELLAEAVATRIMALDGFLRGQAALSVRDLEQQLVEAVSREGDWRGALFDDAQSLLRPLGATGAALLFEGEVLTAGAVPDTRRLREVGLWLDRQPASPILATASLGLDAPELASTAPMASGMVAASLSDCAGEYLIWFRPERAIENVSAPWTAADIAAAHLIGGTVKDVILQFRAVGLLVAKEQLDRVRRQVRASELPTVVADAEGLVLMANDAFQRLLRPAAPRPRWLAELPPLFGDPPEVRDRLRELTERNQAWRGEVCLDAHPMQARPMLVRADPVFSSPDQALGFVLLFTDLTERKAAEHARRRFQDRLFERSSLVPDHLDPGAGPAFPDLLSSVVENAQLAAFEITDGLDAAAVPDMLASVQASVARTEQVLQHLIWHANSLPRAGGDGRVPAGVADPGGGGEV